MGELHRLEQPSTTTLQETPVISFSSALCAKKRPSVLFFAGDTSAFKNYGLLSLAAQRT